MKKISSRGLIRIAFGLLLVLTQSALAQSGTTSVTGHVKDPQGAHLPGATVTLYGRERTFSLTTTTDSTGTYRFDRLAPGEYLVEAEAEGFASASANKYQSSEGNRRRSTFR
jgi:carboxypeptidase family protein